jgi:hypothetical protein
VRCQETSPLQVASLEGELRSGGNQRPIHQSETQVAAHVGTEGNELADRMAMLGAQSKEKELRPYQEKIDIPTLLKMRAG